MALLWLAGALPALAGSAEVATDGIKFRDVTAAAGITFRHERASFDPRIKNVMPWITAGGASVAVGDFNNDGLEDIYFTTSRLGARNHLYRNDGNMHFTEVAESAGLARVNESKESGTSSFALWLDYDNDGWLDLFLLRLGKTALFRNNGDGTFTEVTERAGVLRHTNAVSAVAFDYDHDGYVDLFIGGYFPDKDFYNLPDTKVLFDSWESAHNGGRSYLFRNNGNGTFTDVTMEAGFLDHGWTMALGQGDINNDGWDDLYVANDFGPDRVLKNMQNGKFQDITATAIGVDTKKGMNAELADVNGDGFLDVYVTNMTEPYLHECNMLWRNNGNETFTDISSETNTCDTGWGWGAKFLDVDNDGRLDLYAVNGFISAGKKDYMETLLDFVFNDDVDVSDASKWPPMEDSSMAGYEHNVLLWQSPNGTFNSIGAEAGVDSIRDGRGIAVADFDNDGRLDMVLANLDSGAQLYHNETRTGNHWIEFKLIGKGPKSNRDAVGSKVFVRAGGKQQMREIASANGFESQSTLRAHFGLAQSSKIDEVKVLWSDGSSQIFQGIAGDRIYVIEQGDAPKPLATVSPPTASDGRR
jgi:hypothetical protein